MPDVILHPGRDRSLRRRHPWLLSGAVARVAGEPGPGDWVRVLSAEGDVLGHGHYSPASQIRVRLLAFGKEPVDDDWLVARVTAAVEQRERDPELADSDAVRLVNAEGDGLPGLVADRYGDLVVVKLSSVGMAARRERIAEALRGASGASHGFERADGTAARREGMAQRQGPLWGRAPEAPVPLREGERRYWVDVVAGQKTGFYLDQRDARRLVERQAAGRRVLDLFAYSGGFSLAAAHGGAAAVTLVETSEAALRLAERNLEPFAVSLCLALEQRDAFRFVRHATDLYDLIVLDPPPLARRRGDLPRAARALRELLAGALRRLAPGGELLAFSCSHHLDAEQLRRAAWSAALETERAVQVLGELGAPSDHPVALTHPEGRYLNGLWLRA